MKKVLITAAASAMLVGTLVTSADATSFDVSPQLVKDINPGTSSSTPKSSAPLGSRLVFNAFSASTGDELWITDGTSSGTKLVKDIDTGTDDSDSSNFVPFKGNVYFVAHAAGKHPQIWKTNGTSAGTKAVTAIATGTENGSNPNNLTVVGSTLYFTAGTATHHEQLWRTDGTSAGTHEIVIPNTAIPLGAQIDNLTRFGNKIVFAAFTPAHGVEPWISSGTSSTTHEIRNINTSNSFPTEFTVVGSKIYFVARGTVNDAELWITDGVPDTNPASFAHTRLVRDINPSGPGGSAPQGLTPYAGGVVFRAISTVAGHNTGDELWSSNGTAAGTQMIRDINPGTASSDPQSLTLFKGAVFFSATSAGFGRELWTTKGSLSSTHQIKDINTAANGNSNPGSLRVVGPKLMFDATSSGIDELWETDGTAAGTTQEPLVPGSGEQFSSGLGVVSNTLFADIEDFAHGTELWAYTTLPSKTTAVSKTSSASDASHKKIHISVKVTASGLTPSGTVVLTEGSTTIGSAALSHGRASVHITKALGKGTHTVIATYRGNVKAQRSTKTFTVKVK
jgi:ELWxxDGT repeat protein